MRALKQAKEKGEGISAYNVYVSIVKLQLIHGETYMCINYTQLHPSTTNKRGQNAAHGIAKGNAISGSSESQDLRCSIILQARS